MSKKEQISSQNNNKPQQTERFCCCSEPIGGHRLQQNSRKISSRPDPKIIKSLTFEPVPEKKVPNITQKNKSKIQITLPPGK
ncbi:hypothetical protein M9Y10_045907 [Tritrichomonas musculus]|uniref:Uncharacterized protein n=1 Tax=Tritrichomonas musculus TaxID=1915356 RepID=A0ABR2JWK2_9EUKA